MAPLSMRPIGTSLASAACASADIPSRASGGLTCQTFGRPAATKRSSKFFAAGSSGIDVTPRTLPLSHAVAREHLAHGVDQLLLRHRELRLGLLLAIFVAVFAHAGELGAEDEILDLDFALRFLVGALDDDAGRAALVGIFELRAHSAAAEIELGTDAGGAQLVDHALVVGDAVLVEHGYDHGSRLRLGLALVDVGERGGEPRHADRESRRRHRFAPEPRDQAIVAPAAADR